jgi:hypothetical protein
VYPNPASSAISISFENKEQANKKWNYTLTDVLGKIVDQGVLHHNTIDMTKIPAGMYQLQISNAQSSFTEKIIVER